MFVQGKNDEILSWARTAKPRTKLAPAEAPEGQEIATVAGVRPRVCVFSQYNELIYDDYCVQGCFWGIELAFQRVPGVTHTAVGYTQGKKESPTYEEVCSGSTGHTEAVQMYYNPKEVSYRDLLGIMLERTDPTTKNRQGNDMGTQYRSGIYYHNDEQERIAKEVKIEVQAQLDAGKYPRRTAGRQWQVEILPAKEFWEAEAYHQQYLAKGGRFGQPQCADKNCKDEIRCYG